MWRDITSYSRGQKDQEPQSFELQASRLRIVVTRHVDFGREFILSCRPFFDAHQLGTNDATEARRRAVEIIKSLLNGAVQVLEMAQQEESEVK